MLAESDIHIRILIVEDHDAFRRFVSSMLQEQANWQVIGEVEDGLEAIRQAEALQPDVILLDIGLPGMNGIDTARQISHVASDARIIFLTQESSLDVVRAAFRAGAWGYVLKAQAGAELLAAVGAVSQGMQFVSDGLDGHGNSNPPS